MHRQTFISNIFFVAASDAATKAAILSLPQSIASITFMSENNKLNSLRLLYQLNETKSYQADVSLLPLNDEYTQVNLHLSYADGHAFQYDSHIRQALVNFEYLIQSELRGEVAKYQTPVNEEKTSVGLTQVLDTIAASITGLSLWKKIG